MTIKRRLYAIILAGQALAFMCAPTAAAQVTAYRHNVQSGETLYGLATQYGVTVEQIISLNPTVANTGLKAGSILLIPTERTNAAPGGANCRTMHKVGKKETLYSIATQYDVTVDQLLAANPDISAQDNKIKKGDFICIPFSAGDKVVVTPQPVGYKTIQVAVVLPLLSDRVEAKRSVEFYRGFLMAVEQLKHRGTNIDILTLNEPEATVGLQSLTPRLKAAAPQLVIGPLYPAHFNEMATQIAATPNAKWLIPFSSKYDNSAPGVTPFLLNAPEECRAEYAARLFLTTFGQAKVVFLFNSGSGASAGLLHAMRATLQAAGCPVTQIAENASTEALQATLASDRRTVFIPDARTDGSAIIERIATLRQQNQGNKDISLMGYPEWLSFTGNTRSRLFDADTYIYTASFFNPYAEQTRTFIDNYRQWFQTSLLDVTPPLAPLGYDAGLHMLSGLATYGKDFATQEISAANYQAALRFKAVGNKNYVNTCTYFIHYDPTRIINKILAE